MKQLIAFIALFFSTYVISQSLCTEKLLLVTVLRLESIKPLFKAHIPVYMDRLQNDNFFLCGSNSGCQVQPEVELSA